MPGSCNSGFRSLPSSAAGASRRNGFDVSRERDDARTDDTEHAEHAARKFLGLRTAAHGDGHRPDCEHGDPEQHGAFVTAPRRRELVERRQRAIRMLCNELDAEVVREECVLQNAKRYSHEHELTRGGRSRKRHPLRATERGTEQRKCGLNQRKAKGQDQGELTDLRNHLFCAWRLFASASFTSGGM